MTTPERFDDLLEATHRLVRTVDELDEEALAAPTDLPGWSRAHVIAHLALNAEGLGGVLDGLASGEMRPMYASQARRDADIEALAAADRTTLRERFLASTTHFADAVRRVPDAEWVGIFPRLPDGPDIPRSAIVDMRLREVEIHHADLAVDYTVTDWPRPFLDHVFRTAVRDRAAGPPAMLQTPEGDVALGDSSAGEGPVVTGSRADLTWWLLGRGQGEGLSCPEPLPTLGPWR